MQLSNHALMMRQAELEERDAERPERVCGSVAEGRGGSLEFFKRPAVRRAISPLLILAAWQAGSMTGVVPAHVIAAPSAILVTAWQLTVAGTLLPDLVVSLVRVLVGLAFGISAGIAFALVAGLSRVGEDAVDPPMQMLRALPLLGLTPLLILWFGISEVPKILLIALASFFPVYINLFAGIRAVDRKLVEAATVFGLTTWGVVREVILPAALPTALVGIRQALGIAWLSLVVAEQINADRGLGHMIMDARDFLRTDIIVVGLLVYALLGLATDGIVRIAERRALRWRPSMLKANA